MKSTFSRLASFSDSTWLIGILCFAVLLRLAAIALYPHTPESDELAYLSMAQNFLDGRGLVDSAGNHAFYNMGYSFFVLAPVLSVFPDSVLALRLANTLCGAVSILMVYLLAREAGANRPARLLAALLYAAYLPASVYGVYLAKENLMIPLMLGILWCALRMLRPFRTRLAVLCGLLFGVLALAGNAALSLAAAVALALCLSRANIRIRLLSLPLIALVAGLVVAPWLVRNVHVLGAPVLNSNGGFNIYLGNNPGATGMFVSIGDTPRGPTWHALLKEKGELGATQILKREALEWMASNPVQFAALAVKKLGLFWLPPIHDSRDGSRGVEKLIRVAWLLEYVLLLGGALATVRYLRSRPGLAVLWMGLAAYSGVHMLFYVIFRYREPMMPLACVLAGVALQGVLVRSAKRSPVVATDIAHPEARQASGVADPLAPDSQSASWPAS